MNLYIDESGSINNHSQNHSHFIIAMIHVHDKNGLNRAYKRFVSANHDRLLELDAEKKDPKTGKILKAGGKMFINGKFKELKGSQFDPDMKRKFLAFFTQKHHFDVYYIKLNNDALSDSFCSNTARAFNYSIRLALHYLIQHKYLPNEDCILQLDERNEKTETRYFLENYLNTELTLSGAVSGNFSVSYFDSANNKFIQIADIFANLFYSHLCTQNYTEEFQRLQEQGILRFIFQFPK